MSLRDADGGIATRLVRDRTVVFVEAIVLFLLVWELAARLFDLTVILSSPVIVAVATYEVLISGDWITHFVASMRRILYGFAAAVLVGVFFGVLLGVSEFWRQALRPYVLVGMALPGLLIIIFTAMAFGTSNMTPTMATAIITAPFVADMIQGGVDDIDSNLLNMSGAFGVSRRRVYRRVLFPAILPEVFSAIRFSFSVAWKIIVLAEVVISDTGIGFLIQENMSRLSMTGVLKYLVMFVAVMLLIEYGLFSPIEKRLFDWREDVKQSVGVGAQ